MITKAQAKELRHGQELHYTGRHACTRLVGPRGGVKETITRVRVSGQCKTWVMTPEAFRVPVMHGLYSHGELTHDTAEDFHLPEDCPLVITPLPDPYIDVDARRGKDWDK